MKQNFSLQHLKSVVNRFAKSTVAVVLVAVITVSAFVSAIITLPLTADAASDTSQTEYANIEDFQKARWADIQDAIFGGEERKSPELASSVLNKSVIKGNEYFNWTETGLNPWTGNEEVIGVTRNEVIDFEGVKVTFDVYDISTPAQLRYILNCFTYGKNVFKGGYKYIKVNIKNDLDMGGQNGVVWRPVEAQFCRENELKTYLYIEGNGNSVYNLKMYESSQTRACGLFATPPAFMSVKNIGFHSTMALHGYDGEGDNTNSAIHSVGLIAGVSPFNFYLYNVHSDEAYFQMSDKKNFYISGSGMGGLIGRHPSSYANYWSSEYGNTDFGNTFSLSLIGDRYYKNCSTSNYLMYGSDHIGGIVSTQHASPDTLLARYDSKIPAVPEQYIFKPVDYYNATDVGKVILENNEYPNMFENCYSINCEIFSVGHDSGGFISCGIGIIANNCFTNNTIYSQDNTGGFIGRSTNSEEKHPIKDENNNYTITNSFNNCFSTGIVEGVNAMGGFVGLVNMRRNKENITSIETSRADFSDRGVSVFRNCYSTSMVGVDYAGKYCGGFVGFDGSYGLGNRNATTTINANGKNVSGRGSFYVNCYAAGEVGNILTVTDINNRYEAEYLRRGTGGENRNTKGEILPYYPTGGFAGAVGMDILNKAEYPDKTSELNNIDSTGNFYNCYYDMQTTAMREMAVGMSTAKVSGSSEGPGASDIPYSLKGVKGLYTESSRMKGIDGLTDMKYMEPDTENSTIWQYVNEYYPQLKIFMVSDMKHSLITDVNEDCIDDNVKGSVFFVSDSGNAYTSAQYSKPVLSRVNTKNKNVYAAQMVPIVDAYRYSQASTATVLLDHWDVTMNTSTGAMEGETNWQPGLPQNHLEKTDKTVEIAGKDVPLYKISYTGLASGKYYFKIQAGTGWAYNYGSNGFNGDNLMLVINKDNTDVDLYFAYNGLGSDNYYVYADFVERDLNSSVISAYTKIFHDIPKSDGYKETPWTIAGSFTMMTWYPNADYGLKMAYTGSDGVYSYTFSNLLPENSTTGDKKSFEFKITDGNGWTVNYGKNGEKDGSNMTFTLLGATDVTITFDESTHYTYISASNPDLITNIDVGSSVPQTTYKGYSVITGSSIFTGYNWFKDEKTGYDDIDGAAKAGAMVYDSTLGHFIFKKTIDSMYLDATYGYKIIKDAVDAGVNHAVFLPPADNKVKSVELVFHFDPDADPEGDKYIWVTSEEPSIKDSILQKAKIRTYNVAGAEGLTGFNWLTDAPEGSDEQKAASASGEMMFNNELKLYTKTYYNISPGTYDFKILGNGVWSTGVSYGNVDGDNYSIKLTKTADVTIYFNPNSQNTNFIYVETNPQDSLIRKNYVVSATSNLTKYFGITSSPSSWNTQEPIMKYNINEDIYELWVYDVDANDQSRTEERLGNYSYSYRIVEQGKGNGTQIVFSLSNKFSKYDLRFTYNERTGESSVEVYDPDDHSDKLRGVLQYNPDPIFYSVLGDDRLTGYNWGAVSDSEIDRVAAANAGYMEEKPELSTSEYKVYEATFNVKNVADAPSVTTLSYKVVANGTWDSAIDYGDAYKGNNAVVNLSTPEGYTNHNCKVTIRFKLYNDSNEFELSYTAVGEDGVSDYVGVFDETKLSWHICGESSLYSNNLVSNVKPEVYDTIRDITSNFTFTCGLSSEERGLIWEKDKVRNLKFKDKDSFDLEYNIGNKDVNGIFNPDVLDLDVKAVYDEASSTIATNMCAQYFVEKFAPGKQWIEVNTVGYGYSKEYRDWEEQFVKYNEYLDLVEIYEAKFDLYLHEATKFIYKGKDVNSETLIEFLNYEKTTRPDIYESFVDLFKYDLLENKKYLEENAVEKPTEAPSVASQSIIGTRKIRLIPTAYLEAGNDAQIGVLQSAADIAGRNVINAVSYSENESSAVKFNVGDKSLSNTSFDYYNPALTAGYLITDKVGLGIYNNYTAQTVQKFNKDQLRDDDEISSRVSGVYYAMSAGFAQSSKFTDGGGAATAIKNGLDVGRYVQQSLIGSSYGNAHIKEESVDYAQSIIKVYKLTLDENGKETGSTIVPVDYNQGAIGAYADNYKKWTGQKKFNASDTGRYRLEFYWTLADGRYLKDSKEVNITVLEPGLTKEVDREWDTAGDNELNYTITYTNDRTDYSLNFALLDILPFKGDVREYTGASQSDIKKSISTNADVDFTLESLTIIQSGKSTIRGVYYSTAEPGATSVPVRELGTANIQAAKALGLDNGGRLSNAEQYNFKEAGMQDEEYTDSYSNNAFLDFRKADNEYKGIENCTAVAVTGMQLARGQSVSFTFKLKYQGKAQDFFANNAVYYLKNAEEGASESDEAFNICDPVSTAIISRTVSGYVWYDSNANNIIDEGEPRIKNLGVKLQRFTESKVYEDIYGFVGDELIVQYTSTTGNNGFYAVNGLQKGMYRVVFYDRKDPDNPITLVYPDGKEKTIKFEQLYGTNVKNVTERDEEDYDKGEGVGTRGYAVKDVIESGTTEQEVYLISAISLPTDKEVKYGTTGTNGRTENYVYTKSYRNAGFTNKPESLNSFTLHKVGEKDEEGNDTPLAGVEFKLEYLYTDSINNTTKWLPVYMTTDEIGNIRAGLDPKTEAELDAEGISYIYTTDDDGKISVSGLFDATYRLTEVKTADGYFLLQKPIEFKLPYAVSKSSIKEFMESGGVVDEKNVDSLTYVSGNYIDEDDEYYYYNNISLKIKNSKQFSLPMTGFGGLNLIIGIGFALLTITGIVFVLTYRKKKSIKVVAESC